MADVVTLSDSSDDSDDLPSFADRVKQLKAAESKQTNRCSPLKKNSFQIHSISDSDDSRDTIPFDRDRSTSPICRSPDIPKFHFNKKNPADMDIDIVDINNKSLSPDLRLGVQKKSVYENDDSWNFDNDSPCLNQNGDYLPSLPSLSDNEEDNFNMKNHCLSSDEDCAIKKISRKGKEKKDNKEAEKEIRKKMRLEKQKEKELMKALKASEKEMIRNQKPEECLKNMKIVLDSDILGLENNYQALKCLDENNLNYSFEETLCKYSVNWYRKVINICTENQEIVRQEREEIAETLLVIIPNDEFLKMVHSYNQKGKGKSSDSASLGEFVINVKSLYPGCDITFVTLGFAKYMKTIKDERSLELKTIAKQIHKNAFEEVVIELQLQSPINFKFLDDMTEFGSLIHHFTKAIAEAPQRKEKQMQKALAFSWYAESDSHCPIKLAKDRSSFIKLWRQQIQQFQNVGQEVAEAIVSRYPSPRLLLKAYQRCLSTKDAENLLQDIVVRRNYGPLGTQKRIGPELSFKLYLFFTSREGNKLLKR